MRSVPDPDLFGSMESIRLRSLYGQAPARYDPANERTRQLWKALAQARSGHTPRTRMHTEDAVFRFYLPLARSLASGQSPEQVDVDAAQQAADLGLAQAVLAWDRADGEGFERFACAAISARLRRLAERGQATGAPAAGSRRRASVGGTPAGD